MEQLSVQYLINTLKDNKLSQIWKNDGCAPRQALPKTYLPNGTFYIGYAGTIFKHQTFITKKTFAQVMPNIKSINIDTDLDVLLMNAVVEKGLVANILKDSEKK